MLRNKLAQCSRSVWATYMISLTVASELLFLDLNSGFWSVVHIYASLPFSRLNDLSDPIWLERRSKACCWIRQSQELICGSTLQSVRAVYGPCKAGMKFCLCFAYLPHFMSHGMQRSRGHMLEFLRSCVEFLEPEKALARYQTSALSAGASRTFSAEFRWKVWFCCNLHNSDLQCLFV